jgi:hypothetical protein
MRVRRVYRVMKVHGLLLDRHAGGVERRHDGRIAVDARNRRWCSDGFECETKRFSWPTTVTAWPT